MKDQPAFPIDERSDSNVSLGLTKLEYFAGLAMQGLLSGAYSNIDNSKELSIQAINVAKELLKQLENDI